MRIPVGNFGSVVAEPQQQARVQNSDQVGRALGNVSQGLGEVASMMQHAELQKQRAQAAATLATLGNDLHDLHDTIGRDVTAGTVPAAQAIPEFRKRMGEAIGERTKGLTADQSQLINEHIIKAGGTLERSLGGIAVQRTQAETGANLLDMSEQFQRSAMRDLPGAIRQWDGAVDAMGPAAGWDPAKIASTKQSFKEGASYNFANAALEGAGETGNTALVVAAREKLQGPEGEALDPARRTALITKAYGYENAIKAAGVRATEKTAREAAARENAGTDIYNKAFDLSAQGRYFSTDFISELSTTTAGTKMAGAAQELVKSQAAVAGFASLSLPQQRADVERQRAAGSDPKRGISPVEQAVQAQYSKIYEASVKAYDENPWQAAQERGVIRDAPTISLNNMQDAQQVLAGRMQQIGQIEVAAGRKVSPLQPEEAEQIGRLVRALPPDQQSSALATFGKMIGDGDRLADLARQIDTKDKVLGTAMMVGDLQTTQGRYVSELVLKGARAIKDKAIMMDEHKETGWRGAIAKEVGDAFPNQEVRDKMIDAAYYVQAGFAAEGGGTDTSRALRLVVGRIVEHNGSKIPLPRGMEENDFERRLSSIKPAALEAQTPGGNVFVGKTAVPLAQFVNSLPSASLVHAGQGRYNVRAGMGLVTNAQGKRIMIEVK